MSPPAALALEGLTKRYDNGFLALDGLDLVVPDGAFFGLLGPNGAGKTSLLRMMATAVPPTSLSAATALRTSPIPTPARTAGSTAAGATSTAEG